MSSADLIDTTPRFRLAVEDDSGTVSTSANDFTNLCAAVTAAEKLNGMRVIRGKMPYNRVCEFHGPKLVAVQPLGEDE